MSKNLFLRSILNPKTGDIGLIAEVKLASPSERNLGKKADVLKRAQDYKNAGADAISVITEQKIFKGHPDLVTAIKKTVNLPVLQKDFIVSEAQIEQSRKLGAEALLLIAKIVKKDKLKRFVCLCKQKGLEPIVEIFNSDDLAKAVESETEIIAVNARNLDTYKINVDKACQLLKKIPEKFIKLGFSGIHSRAEVEKYKKAGAKAVLVGTELMKTNDIKKKILELKIPVKVKICGIRSIRAARTAVLAGADFLGFNFVPTSKRCINPKAAFQIINSIKGKAKIVGVFQNETITNVNKIAKQLNLDFVQLHGKKRVLINIATSEKYPLVDRIKQGTGKMVDLEKAEKLARKYSIFLAGGLTPENVAVAVYKVRPFAVDVAGGIETRGVQDLKKIKLFIKNAKGAAL